MRLCVVLAEPRPALAERPRRPSQLALNEQMRAEDALLALASKAGREISATVVAIVVGGRTLRAVARHALTAGVADSIRVPVEEFGSWPDTDAARLVAAAIGHVGCELAIVGAEGSGGWDRLAGEIAEHAGMGLCTSVLAVRGADPLVTEHELDHEHLRLQHAAPLVTTAARSLLVTAPTFGYEAVAASAERAVSTLEPSELGIAPPDVRASRLAFQRLAEAPRRREVVHDGVAPALHFLELIGAVR